MGWACGMNRTERNACRTLAGKTEGDLLENLSADWRIILKWALKETGWEKVGLIFIWLMNRE
jgi:hypothetical protein